MKLSSLMEKNQAGPYKLMRFFFDFPGAHDLKDLQEKMDLSRSTLIKYKTYLEEEAGHLLTLSLIGESLQIRVRLGVSKEAINHFFLASSIRYQILLYLLRNQHFSIQHLSSQLMVSEATLNRHLAALNRHLAEFDLKISKGRLQGPEHQIRYFYTQLLLLTWTQEQVAKHSSSYISQKELDLVERLINQELSLEAKHLLHSWFYVSRKRLMEKDKLDASFKSLMAPFQDNAFYLKIQLESLRFLARYAMEIDESEAMFLFAFLNSSFVLPVHTSAYILGFGGPIMDRLTQVLQYLRGQGLLGDYTSEHVTYQLGQIISQLYFFKGRISLSAGEFDSASIHLDLHYRQLVNQVVERYFKEAISSCLLQKIEWELSHTLFYILEKEHAGLRIALDLDARDILYYRSFHDLHVSLENNRLIQVETYEPGKQYDLIISNQLLKTYQQPQVYYLQNHLNPSDLEAIRLYIQELS